jgi:hypothetical protein
VNERLREADQERDELKHERRPSRGSVRILRLGLLPVLWIRDVRWSHFFKTGTPVHRA